MGPYHRDHSLLGTILASPEFGKRPYKRGVFEGHIVPMYTCKKRMYVSLYMGVYIYMSAIGRSWVSISML